MTKLFAFLSYSGKDIEIAKKIAKELGNQKIFFAEWVLESGYLPNQLARGIFESKWFIIVLSEHALKTRWVEYEINLAIVRFVEEENFKIMAVKIDDCPTPLELKPFVYISEPGNPDQAIKKIIELMLHEPSSLAEKEASSFSILNRYSEIGAIEKASLQGTKIIFLWGIYGIGKSTLANHAIAKIFNRTATIFKLTKGHDEFRLAQEMAARAKLKIPSQSSTKAECIAICVDSYNELIRQGTMVFFDDIDSAIDESNSLNGYLNEILFKISSGEGKVPIFIAASRYPQFDEKLLSSLQILKVGALDEEYILAILEKWIKLADPMIKTIDRTHLGKVASELHGYPLAARLASNIIVKYSIDTVLSDLKHFKDIRIDAAKQLIGHTREGLSSEHFDILKILSIADTGLSQYDLTKITHQNIEALRANVDYLVSLQFLTFERNKVQILPLLKDYFWNIILDQRDWQLLCKAVAIHAQNQLTSCDEDSEDFIHYCTMAYRLYLLSNSLAEAESLKYYYKGEFREAALKLYHAKEYELSLKYVDTYLHLNPQDKRMKFLKVRCLTRLEKYHIAELELRDLEELGYPLYLIAHARGMIYRDQGSIEKAIKEFQKGLDIRKDYLPLLRDYGDLLERIGDYEGALSVLECAFSIQPRDRFVVPKYVSILEKIGDLKSAFSIMSDLVITFPYEASFRHRLSMIYSQLGDDDKAYEEATIAVSLDSHLYEAVLHLASLEIKKEDYTQAEVLLNTLPAKIPNRTKQIRDTIRAELLIRDNKFEAARQIFRQYRHISDSYCYFVMAKIELKDARQDLERENIDLAKGKLEKGLDYCKNGLKLSPSDYRLNVLLKEIESILDLI